MMSLSLDVAHTVAWPQHTEFPVLRFVLNAPRRYDKLPAHRYALREDGLRSLFGGIVLPFYIPQDIAHHHNCDYFNRDA